MLFPVLLLVVLCVHCTVCSNAIGQTTLPHQEMAALMDLFNSTEGYNWNWLPVSAENGIKWFNGSSEPCNAPRWQGVNCFCDFESCTVQYLDLSSYNLLGTIPESLANLTFLVELTLNDNYLNGTIPANLYSLGLLRVLDLSTNNLTGTIPEVTESQDVLYKLILDVNHIRGTIPSSLSKFSLLEYLYLGYNNLNGTIPEELYDVNSIVQLHLASNFLTGTVSEAIGMLEALTFLDLFSNSLTGTLPKELLTLPNLEFVDVYDNYINGTIYHAMNPKLLSVNLAMNRFTGTIPSSIGNLTQLEVIYLYSNNINGTIPEVVYNLTSLQVFEVFTNALEGTLSPSIGNLTNLTTLSMSQNRMWGRLPNSIGNLQKLEVLQIYGNKFSGPVPEELYYCIQLDTLQINSNFFTGTLSESIGNLSLATTVSFNNNLFTGSLPANFGKLQLLTDLYVYSNFLNGTLPEEIFDAISLSYFNLYSNYFTGTLSEKIGQWTELSTLIMDNCLFSGSLPKAIGQLQQLEELSMYTNNFNGSIPREFYNASNLKFLYMNYNRLSGSIHPDISNLTVLHDFFAFNNTLTGNIPVVFGSMPRLLSVQLYSNLLTGFIPDALCQNILLASIYIQYNYLTGSIPSCLLQYHPLAEFTAFGNMLTGTLPYEISSNLLTSLQLFDNQLSGPFPQVLDSKILLFLEMENNYFTGIIADALFSVHSHYEQIYLQNNFLTGTLPSTLGLLSTLRYLDVSSNSFSGSLPSALSGMNLMERFFVNKNILTGSVVCFNHTVQTFMTNIELSNNQFTGSLPVEPFLMPSLETFAAVSNCFTGSISPILCQAQGLTALALDGLHTASSCRVPLIPFLSNSYGLSYFTPGSIPQCLFNISGLNTLHVSGNGIQGSLSSELVIYPALTDLTISYNQFTNSIPNQILDTPYYNLDLSFNKFRGALASFASVNDANDSVYLDVNRLSGNIPSHLRNIESISILDGNLFACSFDRDSLPTHDKQYSYYECGTNSVQQAIYLWIAVIGLILLLIFMVVVFANRSADGANWFLAWCHSLYLLFYSLMEVFQSSGDFADCSVQGYGNIRLLGEFMVSLRRSFLIVTLFVVAVLLPINAVLSHFFGMYEYSYAWNAASVYLSGVIPAVVLLCALCVFVVWLFGVFFTFLNKYHTVGVDKTYSTADDERDSGGTKRVPHYFGLFCVAVFNFTVVLFVNICYVIITTKFSPSIVAGTQLFIALFKIGWNDVVIRYLTTAVHQYVTRKSHLTSAEERILEGKYLRFNINMMLFNIILIPCMATAAVSSDCFYNVIVPPDSVESSYSYITCSSLQTIIQLATNNCTEFESVTTITSFFPPFVYRYQCSSTLVTTYAVLYIYNYIIAAFGPPLLTLVVQAWCHHFTNKASPLYRFLQSLLPLGFRDTILVPEANTRLFYKDQFVLRMMTYLSVFVTFGVIFPPLAVIISCAVWMQSLYSQVCAAKIVTSLPLGSSERTAVLRILDSDCINIGDLFKLSVAVVGPVAALFYGFIIFDTYGDQTGARAAIWPAAVMLAVGCFVSVSFQLLIVWGDQRDGNSKQDELWNERSSEMVDVNRNPLASELIA